jgi:hypothetical protein
VSRNKPVLVASICGHFLRRNDSSSAIRTTPSPSASGPQSEKGEKPLTSDASGEEIQRHDRPVGVRNGQPLTLKWGRSSAGALLALCWLLAAAPLVLLLCRVAVLVCWTLRSSLALAPSG